MVSGPPLLLLLIYTYWSCGRGATTVTVGQYCDFDCEPLLDRIIVSFPILSSAAPTLPPTHKMKDGMCIPHICPTYLSGRYMSFFVVETFPPDIPPTL